MVDGTEGSNGQRTGYGLRGVDKIDKFENLPFWTSGTLGLGHNLFYLVW
jgi:hypothetical protein